MEIAGARQLALLRSGSLILERLTQTGRARLMQRAPKSVLHRFQIHGVGLPSLGKDEVQQTGYFASDLRVDRFGRFFSWGESVSFTGRARQIFSLVSTSSRLSC